MDTRTGTQTVQQLKSEPSTRLHRGIGPVRSQIPANRVPLSHQAGKRPGRWSWPCGRLPGNPAAVCRPPGSPGHLRAWWRNPVGLRPRSVPSPASAGSRRVGPGRTRRRARRPGRGRAGCSFMKIRATCVFAVDSPTTSRSAISPLDRPWATSRRTSISRGVRSVESGGDTGPGGRPPHELLDESTGDRGGEQRVALGHVPDGGGQLGRPDGLEQEPAGAGPHRLVDVLVHVEGGQDEDPGGAGGDQPPGRLDPVQLGHPNVHQRDVGLQPGRQLDGLDAVRRLTHHGQVGLGVEDEPETAPHQRLVIGDQNPDHGRPPWTGSRACTAYPPPGAGPAANTPPYRVARSRIPTRP